MDWLTRLAVEPPETLRLTELVLPLQANHYGTLFGPEALAILGKAAYLAAARFCSQSVVMAGGSKIDLLAPVPVGSLLQLQARVVRVGRSSMTVEVHGWLDKAPGTHPKDALRGSFEMVAVDNFGRPAPLLRQDQAEWPVASTAEVNA